MSLEYLRNFLNLHEDDVLTVTSFKSITEFKVCVRTNLNKSPSSSASNAGYSVQCNSWIKQFSEATKTQWIVRNSWPNLKTMLYRKLFVCHHSNFNKINANARVRSHTRVKGKGCDATVDIKIKKINRFTIRNDSHLRNGLSALITIVFNHSHLIHVAEAYTYLNMTENTKNIFLEYFNNGMTASTARTFHEMKILTSHDEEKDMDVHLANSQLNPRERETIYLYNEWRKLNYGERNFESDLKIMREKQEYYAKNGVDVIIEENPFIVIIVTPVMKRAHEQQFSSEICFVDTTGFCDQTSTCVTFILGAHKIGGIPLACILHSGPSEIIYTHAFETLRKSLSKGFGGNSYPAIFMTDDCAAQRKALSTAFPESKLFLCSFHICQAFWRWLWENKNGIEKSHRQEIMLMFREILYAETYEDCDKHYKTLLENTQKYPQFVRYVQSYWARREEWCIIFRKNHITNHVESSIRVFKDIILSRCKTFGSIALLEFIVNILESYHVKRILNHASNRAGRGDILYKFKRKSAALEVQQINNCTFFVTSATDSHMLYRVTTNNYTLCDCPSGVGGAYCKHICAVELKAGTQSKNSPTLSESDKVKLAYVAAGSNAPQRFFKNMSDGSGNSSLKLSQPGKLCEMPVLEVNDKDDERKKISASDYYPVCIDMKDEDATEVNHPNFEEVYIKEEPLEEKLPGS